MTDYEKELEAFLIKTGQIQPAVKSTQAPKKDEE